jgi:hypothetical protein
MIPSTICSRMNWFCLASHYSGKMLESKSKSCGKMN